MRKYSILNRILSFSLALALLVASPVNVYAVDESSAAPIETVDENIVEETVAEGEVSEPATDIVSEDSNSNSGDASSDESQNNSDASKSEDDSNTEEEVNKEESTDSTSEEVTDEDETSEEDVEEEVTEEEEETEEEDVVLTFENDEVVITVTGSKEVLANITDVTASKITEGENYQSIQTKLSEEAAKEEKELTAFVAYDISLIDENGAEVEPTGAVKVSITSITAPVSEESLADAEVSLVHFEENADVTEMVDLTTEDTTTINTGDDITTVDVEFEVESFSDFAVSWKTPSTNKHVGTLYWGQNWNYNKYANIYVVDENGNAINSATFNWIQMYIGYDNSLSDEEVTAIDGDYFATLAKNVTVSGYTYKGAYFKNKNQVADLCYSSDYGWIYDEYPADYKSWARCYSRNYYRESIDVYLVYSSDSNIGEQYFTANLYNYYMGTVNYANVAALSNQDGVLLFHNCGGDLSSNYSNIYYSGKKWNLCDTNGTSDGTPTAYQGIVGTSLLNNMPTFNYAMADIFNPTSSLFSGNNYDGTIYDTVAYKDVKIPFIKDSKGYYVFDTTSNEASGKFNDYKYDSNSNSLVRNEVDSKSGYWPFGSNDYHFGMDLQVYFNINEDGLNDDDSSATKFEFAGDDDVWVFIDGKLALDMGGVHQTVSGDIDFQNGACTVNDAYNESKSINRATETHNLYTDVLGYSSIAEGRKALASGGHTLTVFYLERGAGASNCKIKFNFHDVNVNVPVDVSFDKVDETGEPLEGATFGLYASTDADCSQDALYTAESTSDGKVIFEDIPAGTYYLKEIDSPAGYRILDDIFTVTVTNGTKVIENGQIQSESAGSFTITDASGKTVTKIENRLEEEIDPELILDYSKTAQVDNWEDRTYAITLNADAYVKTLEDLKVVNKSDVVLVIDATNSMYFPVDLQQTSVNQLDKSSTYYFIENNDAATNYRVYYDNGWKYEDASYTYVTDSNGNTVRVGGGNTGTVRESYNNWSGKYTYYKSGKYGETEITSFYYSPSNGEETRLKQLQEQTTYFLKELNALCGSKCKVGIVYFNTNHGVLADMQPLTKDNTENLINIVNGSYATSGSLESKLSGGTYQQNGLTEAETMINGLNDNNKKYVVTLTDGCPSGSGVPDAVSTIKNRLVQKDVTLLSVGIQLSSSSSAASEVLKAAASDNRYVYYSSSSALETIYDGIIEVITGGKIVYDYKPGTIKDVVDQRFELVPDSNNYGADSIVENSDGTTTLIWNPSETKSWSKTIYVKAKSDFMGGNVITTNTSDSGLTIENETYKFKQPTVNVRLLDMELTGDEITILLNDTFSPQEMQKALVSYFGSNVNFNITEDSVKTLLNNGNVNIPYSYGTTGDDVGTLKLVLSAAEGTPTGEQATATKLGYHSYEYQLKVSYEADSYGDRINSVVKTDANKTAPLQTDIDAGYKLDERTDELYTKTKSVEASYFVNVVDAGMYITKVGGSKLLPLKDAEYVLSADPECKTNIIYNGKSIDEGLMMFKGLGVGTYYLKETVAPSGYALSNEVFTIVIGRNDPQKTGEYKITITSSNNKSDVPEPTTFDVSNMVVKTSTGEVVTTYMINSEVSLMDVIDTIAYTLPETGGSGVYVYTIGGILLMIAGALLLYKNKNNKNK